MHTRSFDNYYENRLIGNLDRGVPLDREASEIQTIRGRMKALEKARLVALQAKSQEVKP